jgi:hypothetical protein
MVNPMQYATQLQHMTANPGAYAALSPLQERILELLGFSSRVYTRLCTVSHEPL